MSSARAASWRFLLNSETPTGHIPVGIRVKRRSKLRLRRLQTDVLDLVQEGAIADLQKLGGLDPIPMSLFQRLRNALAFRREGRVARNPLEGGAFECGLGRGAVTA